MGELRFNLSPKAADAAAARVFGGLRERHGLPAGGAPGGACWQDGTLLAVLVGAWAQPAIAWREGGRARWVAFERDPLSDRLAQVPAGLSLPPRIATGVGCQLVQLAPEQLEQITQAFPSQSAAYFASSMDLLSVHRTRAGSRPCELCLRPVQAGQRYVERWDKQGRDGRRAHRSCGLRAWDLAHTTTTTTTTKEATSWH